MIKFEIIKISFLILLLLPGSLWAELISLNDSELENISAQTGFIPKVSDFKGLTLEKGNGYTALSTGDTGYLSFAGLSIDEYILPEYKFKNFNIELINSNSFQIEMNNLKLIEINSLDTQIRPGTVPGQGNSLGSLCITGYRAEISGRVNISFY